MNRIDACFARLKADKRKALVTYIQAGDPTQDFCTELLMGLPTAGADIIELGMPFSDPSADGPAIDKAAQRAIKGGAPMVRTLEMVQKFRAQHSEIPVVLMGYFNPIMAYGVDRFCADAASAGVDGLIIVDLPPEEDSELKIPAAKSGIHFIRLATPTSDDKRLPVVLNGASGFVYYVAVAGITGGKSATTADTGAAVKRIKALSDLPVAVGFGIKTPGQAEDVACVADAAVVGSAIIDHIATGLDENGMPEAGLSEKVLKFVSQLAEGVRAAD